MRKINIKMKSPKIERNDSLSKSLSFKRKKIKTDNKLKLQILVDKISLILIRKYNTIFQQNKYNKEKLENDIKFLINDIELDNFLFDRLVLEIERIVLLKIVKGREIINDDNIATVKNSMPYVRRVNKSVDMMKNGKQIIESEFKNEKEIKDTNSLIMNLSNLNVNNSEKNICILLF